MLMAVVMDEVKTLREVREVPKRKQNQLELKSNNNS
jgi:hypothetical protein